MDGSSPSLGRQEQNEAATLAGDFTQRVGPIPFCSRGRGAKAEVLFYAAGEITQTVSEKEKEGQTKRREKEKEEGREEPVEEKG